MSDVQLTISKEVVTPIVEAKVKEAVLAAMGGADEIVKNVLNGILTQKVGSDGRVSSYSTDNKYSWLDIVLTKQIKESAEQAIRDCLAENSVHIKDALIKELQSKKGASLAAKAIIDGMNDSFKNAWKTNLSITLQSLKND